MKIIFNEVKTDIDRFFNKYTAEKTCWEEYKKSNYRFQFTDFESYQLAMFLIMHARNKKYEDLL